MLEVLYTPASGSAQKTFHVPFHPLPLLQLDRDKLEAMCRRWQSRKRGSIWVGSLDYILTESCQPLRSAHYGRDVIDKPLLWVCYGSWCVILILVPVI